MFVHGFLALAALAPLFHSLVAGPLDELNGDDPQTFRPLDVFQLEYASDPRISPDGSSVVYVRNAMDVMTDRTRASLWIAAADGSDHRPLVTDAPGVSSPRWSPDGERLLYVASDGNETQLFVRWMDTGQTARLTQLTSSPSGIAWSQDGEWIAFSMLVRETPEPFAEMPKAPEGAEWADPPVVIRKLRYRADGSGYLEDGHYQLFVLPAVGGTPRQVTSGPFDHRDPPVWTGDGKHLVFSANRHVDPDEVPLDSEIYTVSVADGSIAPLTDRRGPDASPAISPDGKRIAYLGFDDRYQGYQVTRLYVMDADGSNRRELAEDLDRSVQAPVWSDSGDGVYVRYDDHGDSLIAFVPLRGELEILASGIGGTTLGRPYASGSFTHAKGRLAYTTCTAHRPGDAAIAERGAEPRRLTDLNADLLDHKELAEIEELWCESSHDGRAIQGWIARPPGFDPTNRYPLLLEIHGGPFANYGARFSAEVELYAAEGYVVLYVNPRGSTSYGEEFGNLIHHNYPGEDYDDLMSAVDAVVARGYVDEGAMYVTGGSGGGVLTAWIVGKTGRFRAAVVAKPVINWTSFALTSDVYNFFYKYWFPGFPWEFPEHYWKRSPLSLVGNVTTPTMLLTGEDDHRTPIPESEQYYQALKLRGIDTALVRIPGASHGIASRPSRLIAKVAHVLKWFEEHGPEE